MGVLFLQRPLQAFVPTLPQALYSWITAARHKMSPIPCQALIFLSKWSKIIRNE